MNIDSQEIEELAETASSMGTKMSEYVPDLKENDHKNRAAYFQAIGTITQAAALYTLAAAIRAQSEEGVNVDARVKMVAS
jgi:hypothetical protein